MTGIFATKTVNPAGADGLLYGNPGQLLTQIIAVVITYVIAGVGTFVILKVLQAVFGTLRVEADAEYQGVDVNEHGEEGYGEELGAGFTMSRVE